MKAWINSLLIFLIPMVSVAQEIDMADTMRGNGKIYVVVGVIAIIFIGLAIYLITLDRRLTSIEKAEK